MIYHDACSTVVGTTSLILWGTPDDMAGANVILVSAANWDRILFGRTTAFTFISLANIRASFLVCIDPPAACIPRHAPQRQDGSYYKNALAS